MSVREEFDAWAAEGRDRGMEDRYWHTAKHVLARMPVEAGDTVLDLGCGRGYAARALRDADDAGRAYGLDGAPRWSSTPAATPTTPGYRTSSATSGRCRSPTTVSTTPSR